MKSWVLKKYKDDDGHPLDLVNPLRVKFGLPLSLYTYDENLRNQINSALYVASASGNDHRSRRADLRVRPGRRHGPQDLPVWRHVRDFDRDRSHPELASAVQAYPMWPAAFGDQSTGPSYASAKIEYMANDKVERLAPKKVSNGNTLRGPFNWAGPQDQYFAAIFLPDNPDTAAMVTLHNAISVPKDPKNPDPNNVNRYDVLGAAVGDASRCYARALVRRPQGASMFWSRYVPTPRPGK